MTKIQTSSNASFTAPAIGTVTDLTPCGQLNTSSVVIYNETGDALFPGANYTITQGTSSINGFLSTQINITGTLGGEDVAGTSLQVSCDYQPYGYITDSGGRGVAALIIIFMAFAIAFAAFPDLREFAGGLFNK